MLSLNPTERLAGTTDPRLRRGLAFAVLESALNAAAYAVVLLFLRQVVTGKLTRTDLLSLSCSLLLLTVLQIAASRPAFSLMFEATFSLMGHARIRVLEHLRRVPMGFFTTRHTGDLATCATSDPVLVEDVWAHACSLFAASLLLPLFVGAGLCFLDWRLGLTVLAVLPIALLVLRATTRVLSRYAARSLSTLADAHAEVVEFVKGIFVLRSFGQSDRGYSALRSSLARLRDAQIEAEVKPTPLLAAYGFCVEMSFVLGALLATALLATGALDGLTFIVFLLLTLSLTRRLFDFGVAVTQIRLASAAVDRMQDLLDVPVLAEPVSAPELTSSDLTVENVTFAYDGADVLHDVSARLPARSLTALVGRSGSGKSTFVNLLARLWDVERGRGAIKLGDVDIRDLPFETLHRHFAMVFQDVVLFSGSVLENIRIGRPDATLSEVTAAAQAAQAHEFISRLPQGYDTIIGEQGAALSGGERQRLSIARAILKDAPIVFLDEATASVDPATELQLQRAIDQLLGTKTVVVVAHSLRTIQCADQILVFDEGRIVERGTHTELLQREATYAQLWQRQNPLPANSPSQALTH